MRTQKAIREAIKNGEFRADRVFKARTEAVKSRAQAVAKLGAHPPDSKRKAGKAASIASGSAGVLVAEGDSWFDYPWTDILGVLSDRYAYDVESVAHRSDRIENMAYADGQLAQFSRVLEKLLRQGHPPKAILLSGGGNDVAGAEFGMLLNHALSPIAGFNASIISGLIDQRIFTAYVTIIAAVTKLCGNWLGRTVPILTHGYDYPVPDGRGFSFGPITLSGPWLEPGFREKGFEALGDRKKKARYLIDRLNDMLLQIPAAPGFAHVSHVDLRKTLSTGPTDYKKYWDNELHPTAMGFELVAAKIAKQLAKL